MKLMSKLFVIGDIHGCNNELHKLLELIFDNTSPNHFKNGDKLVFLGDYIDRGPDSKGVVDTILSLKDKLGDDVITLMGNHEDMLITGDYWLINGGFETLESYGIDTVDWSNYKSLIPSDHMRFYNNLKMYHVEKTKSGREIVCVHAGIDPDYSLDQQNKNSMMWMRTFDGYNGNYAGGYFVVRGHTPRNGIVLTNNQLNIDTACVFGNRLTCAIIDLEENDYYDLDIDYIHVKSEYTYK